MSSPRGNLPPPPWALGPTCGQRLFMTAVVLFLVFVVAPAAIYIFFQETVGDCLRAPKRRAAQKLVELNQKAQALTKAEKWGEAAEVYSQMLASPGDHPKDFLANLHVLRGYCYNKTGDSARALADYDQAIALNPKGANAYEGRAIARRDKGRYDQAVADFSKAIELEPSERRILRARAFALYLKGDYARAVGDWRAAPRRSGADEVYDHLWLFLATARSGGNGTADLAAFRKSRGSGEWPFPIVPMLLGETTPQQLLGTAANSDPKKDREQKCEAYFYIAHRFLAQGNRAQARRHFRQCLDTGVTSYMEYEAAQLDIARMGK